MKILGLVFFTLATTTASMGLAQAIPTVLDCTDPANAENPACLPGAAGVTNFAPLIAGAGGLLALGALAGGGGSTTSTTSTTSTN